MTDIHTPSASSPQCPKGLIQWQHGTYSKATNGSLTLIPFGVDGRQLLSNPCAYKQSVYTRFNQSEYFQVRCQISFRSYRFDNFGAAILHLQQRYEVVVDGFHNVQRLNLYQFDGSPMNPMYLAYRPPQMLPTQTLNPTALPGVNNGPKVTSKAKRTLDNPTDFAEAFGSESIIPEVKQFDLDSWWWLGLGMTAIGGVGYLYFWWSLSNLHGLAWTFAFQSAILVGFGAPGARCPRYCFIEQCPYTDEQARSLSSICLRQAPSSTDIPRNPDSVWPMSIFRIDDPVISATLKARWPTPYIAIMLNVLKRLVSFPKLEHPTRCKILHRIPYVASQRSVQGSPRIMYDQTNSWARITNADNLDDGVIDLSRVGQMTRDVRPRKDSILFPQYTSV